MPPSQLRGFNRRSIDYLIGEGIHMAYDHHLMKENENWGIWEPSYDLIRINPEAEKKGRNFTDLVIVHQWLHPFEDLILEHPKRFRETQIDWWAGIIFNAIPRLPIIFVVSVNRKPPTAGPIDQLHVRFAQGGFLGPCFFQSR